MEVSNQLYSNSAYNLFRGNTTYLYRVIIHLLSTMDIPVDICIHTKFYIYIYHILKTGSVLVVFFVVFVKNKRLFLVGG